MEPDRAIAATLSRNRRIIDELLDPVMTAAASSILDGAIKNREGGLDTVPQPYHIVIELRFRVKAFNLVPKFLKDIERPEKPIRAPNKSDVVPHRVLDR
jgi:hypothetical protein